MARSKQSSTNLPSASALDVLREYGCLTDAQIEQLTGQATATVRKQMLRQALAGAVARTKLRQGKIGRPISLNYLPDTPWVDAASRQHQMRLNDVRIAFTRAWSADSELTVKTWDTQQVSIGTDDAAGYTSDHVRPDGVVLLKHRQASRPLVVLLEIDCGTEPLSRSSTRQSSWSQKTDLYRQFAVVTRWCDWAMSQGVGIGSPLCRLAIVTTTRQRVNGLIDQFRLSPPAVVVWVTTFEEMDKFSVNKEIWQTTSNDGLQSWGRRR